VVGVLWSTPLAVGLVGIVLLRLRIEAVNGGNLDTGDRGLLMSAMLLVPLSCYVFSAVALLLSSGRPLTDRHRVLWVALASALAVIVWLLALGRG
jgi:hypothetical protein